MASLASTFRNQGGWRAEKLFVQVIETRKKVLEAEYPDTLTTMDNLTFTWESLGRMDNALCLMAECCTRPAVHTTFHSI